MNKYTRQVVYKNIGKKGQKLISKSSVCIVGVGALGTVCAELLTRAGVGKLTLIDRDYIELINLQRQTLFTEKDIGKTKALTAKEELQKINSDVEISAQIADLTHKNISLLEESDIILGCTDNMESRFLINDYSLKNNTPWIYGGAVADRGSVFNIFPGETCFRCIFSGSTTETCDTIGILNTNSTLIASLMANETCKIILNDSPEKKLIHMHMWNNTFEKLNPKKNPECPACKGNYEYLKGKRTKVVKLCGRDTFQFKTKSSDLDEMGKNFKKQGPVKRFKSILHFKDITLFEDGRVFIRAKNKTEARKIYSKYIGN